MKKLTFIFMVGLAFMVIISCQSTGSTTGADSVASAGVSSSVSAAPSGSQENREPQAEVPPVSPARVEDPLQNVYDKYDGTDIFILTGAETYTVVSGDSLTGIARSRYGSAGDKPYYFPLIMAASKNTANIVDPDRIEIGMKLIIPNLQANLDNARARSNLKSLLKDMADIYARKGNDRNSIDLREGLTRLYNSL